MTIALHIIKQSPYDKAIVTLCEQVFFVVRVFLAEQAFVYNYSSVLTVSISVLGQF